MEQVPKNDAVEGAPESGEHDIATDYKALEKFASELGADHEEASRYLYYGLVSGEIAINESNYKALIEKGLNDPNPEMQYTTTLLAGRLPDGDHAELIAKGLQNSDPGVRANMQDAISSIPEDQRAAFVTEGLEDDNAEVRMSAVFRISDIPDEQVRLELVKKALLKDEDWGVRYAAEVAVQYVPEGERTGLFIKAFESGDDISRLGILEKAERVVPPMYLSPLLIVALKDEALRVSTKAASMIQLIPNRRERKKLERLSSSAPNKSFLRKILGY